MKLHCRHIYCTVKLIFNTFDRKGKETPPNIWMFSVFRRRVARGNVSTGDISYRDTGKNMVKTTVETGRAKDVVTFGFLGFFFKWLIWAITGWRPIIEGYLSSKIHEKLVCFRLQVPFDNRASACKQLISDMSWHNLLTADHLTLISSDLFHMWINHLLSK